MSDPHQNKQNYIIAARYNLKTKFIFLQELSLSNFLDQCAIEFNFNCNTLKLILSDNRNASITRDNFNDIVQTFSSSASFYVNIDIIEQNANVPIVSVKCLEDFLVNENAGPILQMQRSNPNYNLSKNQLNFVIRLLGEFTQQRFGTTPSPKQKEAAAKSFVDLFPSVQMTTLLNASDGGKLGIQLRNKRAIAKRQHVQQYEEVTLSDEEAKEVVEVLKSTAVNSQNMDNIKNMLTSTLKYRTELLKKEEINLREYFPYFWVSNELVLFEFHLRYPNVQNKTFSNKWNKLSARVNDVVTSHYGININTLWSTEIGSLLGLLKILPAKAVGKKIAMIESSFKKAEQKLIVFRQTNHPISEWEEKNNKYPYILAFGDSKSSINHYLIELEREFSSVPHDSTIGEVFELFFMLHKIFKMQCDPNLERLFNFVEHFIFDMDVDLHLADNSNGKKRMFKPTTAMQLLFDQLNNDE